VARDGETTGWSSMSTSPRYSQSLERGLAILACFTPQRRLRGIAEMAEELGMSRSTTHRYMSTLAALGYLEQERIFPKCQLAPGVVDLGIKALDSIGLRECSRACLESLRRETSLASSLAVLCGQQVLLVDHIQGSHRGQFRIGLRLAAGSQLPVHCTALGKLLVAYLPQEGQDRLVSGLKPFRSGPRTIMSKKALRNELRRIRLEGLAVEDEEFTDGLVALAAPVRDGSGDVRAALGIVAPTSMLTAEELRGKFTPQIVVVASWLFTQLDAGTREASRRNEF
jgi:IclR family transcriptional regulator, pca regulon regulatory protein